MASSRLIQRTLTGLHAMDHRHIRGTPAGIEQSDLKLLPSSETPAKITVIDYSPNPAGALGKEIKDVTAFVADHRPDWSQAQGIRWINVDGLTDMKVIHALAEKYDLHPLAVEDLLHVPQRPKVEPYPEVGQTHGRLFIIARMLRLVDDPEGFAGKHLLGEQVSIFLGHKTVLTFQERPDGDVFDPVRTRINTAGSRVRVNDASFLVYSLLDAIVDEYFPILEHYSDLLEDLEDQVLQNPQPSVIERIHTLKRELLLVRRASWPMREMISGITREVHPCLSETTRTYLRDVYDHAVQIIDMVETYREFASGLTETYMSALSNRMNQIMKVLTIIGTIFIPLTFLAGVYGMNFKYLPELNWDWAYPAFWVICFVTAGSMILWFKRRGWL